MADVKAGDLVQIRVGGRDVTNGQTAKAGWKYVEGSSLWATVEKVVPNWTTNIYGTTQKVTKVRCVYGGTVVWQVEPKDIVPQVIKASEPEIIQTTPPPQPPVTPPTDTGNKALNTTPQYPATPAVSTGMYATMQMSTEWRSSTEAVGVASSSSDPRTPTEIEDLPIPLSPGFQQTVSPFEVPPKSQYVGRAALTAEEKRSLGSKKSIEGYSSPFRAVFDTAPDDPVKRLYLTNDQTDEIQNSLAFPYKLKNGGVTNGKLITAQYDYQIIPNDPRYPVVMSLEDRLKEVRAAFGLPVHGNNMIARAMKYYLYNRYKSPDINNAHNKTFTHVFFTRPDLNILSGMSANSQVLNHTDAALIWRRYPEIFKLLTKGSAVHDTNNFNLLLSNQVTSFDIQDESISNLEAGKSWNEYSMLYGDVYTGRTAGEFTCSFNETSNFDIINMMKLWITYIDNVARGAWSPSYNLAARSDGVSCGSLDDSYVYQKALDYAASAYVFKVGPDGEDVLYWSKYYGVFPSNTGANALSWDLESPVGSTPKLSIKFNYCYKKDLSPISLIEFNDNAYVSGSQAYEPGFNTGLGHSDRPYVGCPYIALEVHDPILRAHGVSYEQARTQIRLKFRPASVEDSNLTDDIVYRSDLSKRASAANGVQMFTPSSEVMRI